MISSEGHTRVDQGHNSVAEHLHVAQSPPTEEEHQQRRKLHRFKGELVQLVVVDWWSLEVVRNKESVHDVVVEESECSDREHDWKCNAIHEGDPSRHENSGVAVRHDVLWTGISVNVSLNRLALGCLLLLAAEVGAESLVKAAEENQSSERNTEIDVCIHRVDRHSHNQRWRNHDVPLFSQVGEGSTDGNPREDSHLTEIGISQEQQDCRVEERCDKYRKRNRSNLTCLSVVADHLDQHNTQSSDDRVDNGNRDGDRLTDGVSSEFLRCENVAQVIRVGVSNAWITLVSVTEALVDTSALLRNGQVLVQICILLI